MDWLLNKNSGFGWERPCGNPTGEETRKRNTWTKLSSFFSSPVAPDLSHLASPDAPLLIDPIES